MSTSGSSEQNAAKIISYTTGKPLPVALVIKKDRSITIVQNNDTDRAKLMNDLKISPKTLKSMLYKEDVIYESRPDDFWKGNPLEKLVIVNTLDRLANSSRTVARYYSTSTDKIIREITSDNVVKLIGQSNYEAVFSALCSVINQESKVRGILSLLTVPEDTKAISEPPKSYEEKCCQTDLTENCMDILYKMQDEKKRKIRRSQINPYIVTAADDPVKKQKRVVIHPDVERRRIEKKKSKNMDTASPSCNVEPVDKDSEIVKEDTLPDIRNLISEDSNCSIGNLSAISNYSAEDLLENPNKLLKNVDRYTDPVDKIKITNVKTEVTHKINKNNWPEITLLDGSVIKVPVKPEDNFHIATPDILKCVSNEERVKLLYYQAYMDWKFCMQKDSDGYMPIHFAVINDDVPMLRRQCLVLRSRHQTLDVEAADLTPLQMVLLQDTPHCGAMAATLLKYGADPLLNDNELKSPAHLAAEAEKPGALEALLTHCQKQARSILQDHEELWKPEYVGKSDEELSRILLGRMCNSFNGQGYTPLMIASSQGRHRNVELLLKACPWSVNTQSPNAGDTALYIAVGAACMHCSERGNKSKVADKFKDTIKALVTAGADLFIENLSGSNVKDLLADSNIPELSLLVGNQVTSFKFFDGAMPENDKNCGAYMLEECDGEMSIKELTKGGNGKKRRAKGDDKASVAKIRKVEADKKETNTTDTSSDGQTLSDKKIGIIKELDDKIAAIAKIIGDVKVDHGKVVVVNNLGNIKDGNKSENYEKTGNVKGNDDKDVKTKAKPVILENKELPNVGTTLSKPVQISSNVKYIQLHDKLEKTANTSTSDPETSTSSNVAMQNVSKIESTSSKNASKIIKVINSKKYQIIDASQLSSNALIVKRKTLVKRSEKVILNPNAVKKK